MLGRWIQQVAREASHRPKILWVGGSNVKRTQTAIRTSRNVELFIRNLVIVEKLYHKCRKHFGAFLEEQLAVWRSRYNDDITQTLGLFAPVSLKRALNHFHRLWTAGKGQHPGIRLSRIIIVWENDLVVHHRSGDLFGLIHDFCVERAGCKHAKDGNDKDRSRPGRSEQIHWFTPPFVRSPRIIPPGGASPGDTTWRQVRLESSG